MQHVVLLASLQHAVFAGGCFWGVQGVFEHVRGVVKAVAGYAGGNSLTAHYEIVSTGATGHAESVDVTYDPARVSFEQLLDVYFLIAHDPTQLNRQGPDEGTQYRSEIFYTTAEQRDAANAKIAQLQSRRVFSSPIVTKVAPLSRFFAAEAYHQDYMVNNPNDSYITINDKPKIERLERRFPSLFQKYRGS